MYLYMGTLNIELQEIIRQLRLIFLSGLRRGRQGSGTSKGKYAIHR